MEDEEDLGLYEIDNKAANVTSCQNFIEFLEMLNNEVLEDDEARERLQLEFFNVMRRALNYSRKFPDKDVDIEIPDEPDWIWLARLFIIGAFEN